MRPSLLLLVLAFAAPLSAQREAAPLAPQFELRPGIALPINGLRPFAGIGLNVRAGWYARVGAAVSAEIPTGDSDGGLVRGELTARFLLDPYAEQRSGLYGGVGLGMAATDGTSSRGEFLLVLGVEGNTTSAIVPALEFTLGGGLRLTGVLRWRRDRGR